MFELVPSEFMRMIFKDRGFELTDFNKATLIWNRDDKSRAEKIAALQELSDTTNDTLLKRQIRERLDYENDMVERLMENADGKCVYEVEDEDEYSCGFFTNYDMAYKYGIKHSKKYEEEKFSISKQHVVADRSDLTVRSPGRTNWNLVPADEIEKNREYDGNPVSQIYFNSNGEVRRIWSNEMSEEAEAIVDEYRKDRFEFQFIKIPFEGWIGTTPVRVTTDDTYGILMQDTNGWNRYLRNIEERNLYVDYSDIQVEVVFLTEQGVWMHEHINPIFLEVETPKYKTDNKKDKAYIRAMEFFFEYWERRNKDSKYNNLKEYEKRVIESARAYRDICLEAQAEEEKRKNGIVDRAKTVEDLIW